MAILSDLFEKKIVDLSLYRISIILIIKVICSGEISINSHSSIMSKPILKKISTFLRYELSFLYCSVKVHLIVQEDVHFLKCGADDILRIQMLVVINFSAPVGPLIIILLLFVCRI